MGNVKTYSELRKKSRKAQNFEVRNTVRPEKLARDDQRRAVSYGRARGNL